jgi:AraC-like DNA-binding protein
VRLRLKDLRTTCFSKLPRAIQFKAARFLDPVLNAASKDDRLPPWEMEELDLERAPNVVTAVLPFDLDPSADLVRSLVRADRFQRRCVEFARTLPQTLCARLEDHGAYFLSYLDPRMSKSAARSQLDQQSRKISAFVQEEFGARAYIGIGPKAALAGELAQTAKQAVLAMQLAVHRNAPVVFYEDEKQELYPTADRQRERPRSSRYANQLLAQFSNADFAEMELTQAHYVRQVLEESGGRAAVMRVYFEQFLFSLLELVQKRAQLDNRTLDELEHNLSTALGEALTSFTLLTVFRHWFDNLLHISREPGKGQKELRLERAAQYIKENCHRPLSLEEVARQVGFSTNYFSRIFKGAFGTGFAQHLLQQRLERAKELLRKSTLAIHHVSQESGFASVTHFCGVFKQATRLTPQQYRDQAHDRGPRERPRRSRGRIRAVRS